MTIDHESIVEKKSHLQQAIRSLRNIRQRPPAAIVSDEILTGALLHYIMMGIESILDIGSHILAEDFSIAATSYEEVISLLGGHHIISDQLAHTSAGMGKFRNKLIHEYAEIDLAKVQNYLQHAPEQFEEFDSAFSRYLQAKR
jgi:uncharacterized protein YutE (UPF0331/DUF86 family)